MRRQINNQKQKHLLSFIFSVLILNFLFFFPRLTFAQSRIESDNYRIQFPNLNSGAGIPSSANFKVNSTIGQTAPGIFSSTNFKVRSGFQYIHSIIPFSFTISNIAIDFETLTPGTPKTRTTTLTVKAGGAGGYSVKAAENHPLAIDNNAANTKIADTLCDNGNCTATSAEEWIQNTTYGFGFNIWGDDIPTDIETENFFRQFADLSAPESPAVIMTKSAVTWDYPNNIWPWESVAIVTYKLNIGGTQGAGTYSNIVKYTAIPSF